MAFVVGMSHIGDGIIATKGKLFPFGIFKIFAAGRKSKQLNLLLEELTLHTEARDST